MCPEAWPVSARLPSSNALKWWPCRGPPPQHALCVLHSPHLCYWLFLKNVIRLYRKMLFSKTFSGKCYHKPSKYAWPYFHSDDNNCFQDKPICTGLSFCITHIFYMHRVQCLNYSFKLSQVKLKKAFFVNKVVYHNTFFNKQICIIRCFQTHWGRVTHICVSKLTIISSDNGLSPGCHQAIIWTNAGKLLFGPPGTNFNKILIEMHTFSSNCIWKCRLGNGRHFVSASMC